MDARLKRTVAVGIVDRQRTGGEWINLLAEYSNEDDCLSAMNEKNHFIAKICSQKSVDGTATDTTCELCLVWVQRMDVEFSGGTNAIRLLWIGVCAIHFVADYKQAESSIRRQASHTVVFGPIAIFTYTIKYRRDPKLGTEASQIDSGIY